MLGPTFDLLAASTALARESYAEWGVVQPDLPGSLVERRYTTDASEFVDVDGARVHYRDEGPRDGPVLLAVHGVYSSLHTWEGWVDELDDIRVVSLDLPGFGLTGPTDHAGSGIPAYLDFLDAFCETLGLHEVAVAGHSLGGAIAWRFAVTHADRVERLLLVDAGRQHLVPPAARLLASPALSVVPRYLTPRTTVRAILRDAYADPEQLSRETVRRYHDLLLRTGNRRAVLELTKAAAPAPFSPTAVSCPTLVQWGEADEWLPPSLGERFVHEIPDATMETYPGVGHVPTEESPRQTARDAADFLHSSPGVH